MEVFFLSDDEVLNFMIFSFLLVEQRFTFFLLYHYKMDKIKLFEPKTIKEIAFKGLNNY